MVHPKCCELVKKDNKLQFADTVDEKIDEWPHSWKPLPRELSYRLNNISNDMSKTWQERAVTVSLRAWRWRLKNLSFRRERNPDVKVDINVKFGDLDSFGGKKGVLARAYYPGQGDVSGDIEINDWWNWVPGVHLASLAKPPMVPILIHEVGHGIGLTHDPYHQEDIMYPSFNRGQKKNRIGPYSIERGQDRYGVRSIAAWKIAYFLRRRDRGSDFR